VYFEEVKTWKRVILQYCYDRLNFIKQWKLPDVGYVGIFKKKYWGYVPWSKTRGGCLHVCKAVRWLYRMCNMRRQSCQIPVPVSILTIYRTTLHLMVHTQDAFIAGR